MFLLVCSTSLLKTLREKEELPMASNFSIPHGNVYMFGDIFSMFIKIFNSELSSANSFSLEKSKVCHWEKVRVRVVLCPSCVVNNFFKHFLLPNRLANLDQTLQERSLGDPLQKVFTEFYSIKNSGCHGNEMELLNSTCLNISDCVENIVGKEKMFVTSNVFYTMR